MKNFDLEAAKRGAAVCIRSGENVRIICYDKKGTTPCLNNRIVYLANYNGREHTYSCYSDGRYMTRGEDDADLMMRDDDYLEKLERGEYGNHIADANETVLLACKDSLQVGLTKREWFAGMAMQGIFASYDTHTLSPADAARFAIICADALIAELEKAEKK